MTERVKRRVDSTKWKVAIAVGIVLLWAAIIGAMVSGGNNDKKATNARAGTTTVVATTSQSTATTKSAPKTATTAPKNENSDACARAGQNVENYDILAPGASRGEYLTLLHTLQRDCPREAESLGLTSDFLPQCKKLAQENCTMYQKP